jgi:NhaP-type Na+/H+ or K+/H+ antiporter
VNTILSLAIILVTGIIVVKILSKLKIPEVTGYLILGIIIGQEFLSLIHVNILESTGLISNIVLGLVAFTIGRDFAFKELKRLGKPIIWISLPAALGATIIVTLIFYFIVKQPLYISIIYGAIASATAPAATLMVIKQYKAKGYFTKLLLGVVAIDDAWCLIIFAISLAVAKSLHLYHPSKIVMFEVVLKSLVEIGGSLLLGGSIGYILVLFSKFFKKHTEIQIYTLGIVLLSIGLAIKLNLSILLTTMALGAVLVNFGRTPMTYFDSLGDIESPLFLVFFVLAGANLEISALKSMGIVGIAYILSRSIGKIAGAYIGGVVAKVPNKVRNYIGIALLPQAGVALGVALIAKADFPSVGNVIFSTILATTVVFEMIGPILTKFSLSRAGDI